MKKSISSNVADLIPLRPNSKGTRRTLGHLRYLGTWTLEVLAHSKSTVALGHSSHLDTRVLGDPGTQGTWGLEALYLANVFEAMHLPWLVPLFSYVIWILLATNVFEALVLFSIYTKTTFSSNPYIPSVF